MQHLVVSSTETFGLNQTHCRTTGENLRFYKYVKLFTIWDVDCITGGNLRVYERVNLFDTLRVFN